MNRKDASSAPIAPQEKQATWPTRLRFVRREARLIIDYNDGFTGSIPFELLRIESPSAETQGHGSTPPPPPPGKRNVSVVGADRVGRYAVRIRFSDGHDTGLYTWTYLRELCSRVDDLMLRYLDRLDRAGLSREP